MGYYIKEGLQIFFGYPLVCYSPPAGTNEKTSSSDKWGILYKAMNKSHSKSYDVDMSNEII